MLTDYHVHPLLPNSSDIDWACDGRKLREGCASGCTGYQQTRGWNRYRCNRCDFNLCEGCLNRGSFKYSVPFHPHPLRVDIQEGWLCDGSKLVGGCVKGCTGFNQTSGWKRYRCTSCDFDLCEGCLSRSSNEKRVGLHQHALVEFLDGNGWMCDGSKLPGGCVNGCTDFHHTSGWTRYRCVICDFDLCEGCVKRFPNETRVPFHQHGLVEYVDARGWICDGSNQAGGCVKRLLPPHQTSGWKRYRCLLCDFDLCEGCLKKHQSPQTPQTPQTSQTPQVAATTTSNEELERLRLEVLQLKGERSALRSLSTTELERLRETLQGSLKNIDQRLQELNSTDDTALCLICKDRPKNVLLLPCRHLCMCNSCSQAGGVVLKSCPLCRQPIADKMVIFT